MSESKQAAEFRTDLRSWLAQNCPEGVRDGAEPNVETTPWGSSTIKLDRDSRIWLERMAERGFTVPTWPVEYGGAGLDRELYPVLIEELKRINARAPLTGRGVNYIGPTILELGTDAQKARWLPGIARGEGGWAMGYSEPGAGSDLASLSCRADLNGDHYVVNGRKVWTSDAMDCDYIFILARTDPQAPQHLGISLLLVEMHQAGVQVSPIRLLSGASPFNETVFENAIALADDVIGGVNNGWTVGKRLLQFERSTHAGINTSGSQGGRASDSALPQQIQPYLSDQPALRRSLVKHQMSFAAQRLTQQRVIEETAANAPGFASSAVKLSNALITQAGDELLIDALGTKGVGWEGEFKATELIATRTWLKQKSLTIAGGTMEVQKNIIAKRVLGLPD
jgi:alkylation response protein AidB-like acyl-CoA dehydrogenase